MKKTLSLLALFFTISTFAQQIGDDKLGSWHMYFGTNTISEKVSLHTEAQMRYYENGKNFNLNALK